MGGEVNVESQVGKGSKFIITQQVKAIDLNVIVNDVEKMNEKEKDNYLTKIRAFDFASNFQSKFQMVE